MNILTSLLLVLFSLITNSDDRLDKDYTYTLTIESQVETEQDFEVTILSTNLSPNADEEETKIKGVTPWTLNLKSDTHKIHVKNAIEEIDIIKVTVSAIADGEKQATAASVSYIAALVAGPDGAVRAGN